MFDRGASDAADREREMQRAVAQISPCNGIAKAGGEREIRKCPAHVWPFFQLQASVSAATQAQAAQGLVARDPAAEGHGRCPKLFPRFIEVKHKIRMRLHNFGAHPGLQRAHSRA